MISLFTLRSVTGCAVVAVGAVIYRSLRRANPDSDDVT